jgi:hypothetical protein
VLAALAAGQVSESVGRVICLWTDKLPSDYRDQGDEQLLAAFGRVNPNWIWPVFRDGNEPPAGPHP